MRFFLMRLSKTLCSYHLFHATLWKWRNVSWLLSTIIGDMLQRVCDEMDYRTDVCHVTRGGEYWASGRLRRSCRSSFTNWFRPHVRMILSHLVINFWMCYILLETPYLTIFTLFIPWISTELNCSYSLIPLLHVSMSFRPRGALLLLNLGVELPEDDGRRNTHTHIYIYIHVYRVSREECARLRENVP